MFNQQKREKRNLAKIDGQLTALDMKPIASKVEHRLALAHIRQSRTHLTYILSQTGIVVFGVIAAAYAIPDKFTPMSGMIILSASLYLLLQPTIVSRRGRRAATLEILRHRVGRTAAFEANR